MKTDVRSAERSTGVAAMAAGVLLAGSVAAELVHPVQTRDGAVLEPALFDLYLAAWVAGTSALIIALRGLAPVPASARPARRTRRVLPGHRLSQVGAGLLLAWGIVALGTATATGKPLEASFVLFGLGLLLTGVGNVLLGLSFRRGAARRTSWPLLVVAGAGALVAVTVFADPWHDVGMFTFAAGWVGFGATLLRAAVDRRRSDARTQVVPALQ